MMSDTSPQRLGRFSGENSPALRLTWLIIGVGTALGVTVTVLTLTLLPTVWGSSRVDEPQVPPGTTLSVADRIALNNDRSEADDRVRNTGLKIAAGIAALTAGLVAWG